MTVQCYSIGAIADYSLISRLMNAVTYSSADVIHPESILNPGVLLHSTFDV